MDRLSYIVIIITADVFSDERSEDVISHVTELVLPGIVRFHPIGLGEPGIGSAILNCCVMTDCMLVPVVCFYL